MSLLFSFISQYNFALVPELSGKERVVGKEDVHVEKRGLHQRLEQRHCDDCRFSESKSKQNRLYPFESSVRIVYHVIAVIDGFLPKRAQAKTQLQYLWVLLQVQLLRKIDGKTFYEVPQALYRIHICLPLSNAIYIMGN